MHRGMCVLCVESSVPARLGAKKIVHNLARERPKFGHNLVRKRQKIWHSLVVMGTAEKFVPRYTAVFIQIPRYVSRYTAG